RNILGVNIKTRRRGGSHENDEAARPHSSDRFCDWLHSDSRRWFYPTRATEAETGCRLQWRAAIQGRSFLAEAAAESLGHAAGHGYLCRSERSHLVFKSRGESRSRRSRRRK